MLKALILVPGVLTLGCHQEGSPMEKKLKQEVEALALAEKRTIKSIKMAHQKDRWNVEVAFKGGDIDGMTVTFDDKGTLIEKRYWQ